MLMILVYAALAILRAAGTSHAESQCHEADELDELRSPVLMQFQYQHVLGRTHQSTHYLPAVTSFLEDMIDQKPGNRKQIPTTPPEIIDAPDARKLPLRPRVGSTHTSALHWHFGLPLHPAHKTALKVVGITIGMVIFVVSCVDHRGDKSSHGHSFGKNCNHAHSILENDKLVRVEVMRAWPDRNLLLLRRVHDGSLVYKPREAIDKEKVLSTDGEVEVVIAPPMEAPGQRKERHLFLRQVMGGGVDMPSNNHQSHVGGVIAQVDAAEHSLAHQIHNEFEDIVEDIVEAERRAKEAVKEDIEEVEEAVANMFSAVRMRLTDQEGHDDDAEHSNRQDEDDEGFVEQIAQEAAGLLTRVKRILPGGLMNKAPETKADGSKASKATAASSSSKRQQQPEI